MTEQNISEFYNAFRNFTMLTKKDSHLILFETFDLDIVVANMKQLNWFAWDITSKRKLHRNCHEYIMSSHFFKLKGQTTLIHDWNRLAVLFSSGQGGNFGTYA